MPTLAERPPIPDERRLAVSQWIEHNVRPVAHAMAEEDMNGHVVTHPFEVRDHQIEGWDALWQARLAEATRGLIHLATGGGKTTLSAVDFLKYREECLQMDPPVEPRALYVSHKHEINQQAAETFRRIIPGLEEHFFDTRKADERPEADITYAPIQSIFSKLHTFDPEEFEYIIWDEAHHLEAETYKKVLEHFRPLFEYALTGTPDRSDGKDIRDYFGEALLSKGIPEGIAEGWLAEVDYHIVFDKAIREAVRDGFNPKSLKEIKDLFEKKASPEALRDSILEEIEKLGLENPKTMVFCESIEEADEMARLLGGVAYHSSTPNRPQILKDFKSGKIKVVTSKDMFNEGVDVPDAELVIFLRATESDNVFQQQLGRGLRKIPGKDKVYVLDFVANIERIAKVRELSDAIQKATKQKGDDVDITDGPTTGGGGGLKIHTRHGNFDFDTIAVDLLEKWGAAGDWRKNTEEFMSINRAAQELGVARDTFVKLCEKNSIVLQERRFKTGLGYGIDGAQFQILKNLLHSEDEFYGVHAIASELGIGPRTIKRLAEEDGLELQRRSIEGKKLGLTITKSQLDQLKEHFPNTFLEKPATGWLSIPATAQKFGVDDSIIKKIIDRKGWELPLRKFNTGAFETLSPEQIAQIPDLLIPTAPEGARTLKDLARELGVSDITLKKVAIEEGMNPSQFKFDKRVALGVSPEHITKLTEVVNSNKLPENCTPVSHAAKYLGVNEATVMKQVEDFGWTLKAYRFGPSGRTYGVTTDQLETLKQSERIQRAAKKSKAE